MYVCMYVRMHVCMYVYTHEYMRIYLYICIYVYTYVLICMYTHACMLLLILIYCVILYLYTKMRVKGRLAVNKENTSPLARGAQDLSA